MATRQRSFRLGEQTLALLDGRAGETGESGNDVGQAAEYLSLSETEVRTCVSYYAEFRDEIDAWAAEDEEFTRREGTLAG